MGAGGQLDIPCNIVSGDRRCHDLNHAGKYPKREDLLAVVASRYRVTADDVLAEIQRALNILKKGDRYECPFTDFWWQKTLDGYIWSPP
jgi:hypothetical protein